MTKHGKKKKPPFKSTRLRMKDNHSWTAPKGYKIVVLDRGAVSFNIPQAWVLAQMMPHVEIYDQAQPDDNARLSVSYWRVPPGIDWAGLPLGALLLNSLGENDDKDYEILERGDIIPSNREDIELVWTYHRFIDPQEKREAISRFVMARGFDVHVLMTFDFWVDDAETMIPAWEEAVRSLQLGRVIEDPTRGAVLH